jgi:hypothetical protein
MEVLSILAHSRSSLDEQIDRKSSSSPNATHIQAQPQAQSPRPAPKYIYSITPVMSTMDNGAVLTMKYMEHLVDWYMDRINKLWLPENFEESMKQGLIDFCGGIRYSRNKIYFCCRKPIRSLDSPFAKLLIPGDEDCHIEIDGITFKVGATELRSESLVQCRAFSDQHYHNKELYHTIF